MDRLVKDDIPLVLGSAQWGMPYGIANDSGIPDDDALRDMLAVAWDAGVRWIDSARAYGDAEERIGRLGHPEMRFGIITKLAPRLAESEADAPAATLVASALHSVHSSLRALRTDYIDVLLLHRATHRTIADGAIWHALVGLRAAGHLGRLGVSARDPDEAFEALEAPDVDVVEVASSALDRRLLTQSFFARARAAGRQVLVRSVFLQGAALLDPERLPNHLTALAPWLARLDALSVLAGTSRLGLLLRYARDRFAVPLIIGVERVSQLTSCLHALRGPALPLDVLRVIDTWPMLAESVLDPSQWPPSPQENS